ncbi:MAG: hypothetical protein V4608_01180 [Bacteroidota bacterium]
MIIKNEILFPGKLNLYKSIIVVEFLWRLMMNGLLQVFSLLSKGA